MRFDLETIWSISRWRRPSRFNRARGSGGEARAEALALAPWPCSSHARPRPTHPIKPYHEGQPLKAAAAVWFIALGEVGRCGLLKELKRTDNFPAPRRPPARCRFIQTWF